MIQTTQVWCICTRRTDFAIDSNVVSMRGQTLSEPVAHQTSPAATAGLQLDLKFFDFAIQAGESQLESFGGFLLIRALLEDSCDVQTFVVPQS